MAAECSPSIVTAGENRIGLLDRAGDGVHKLNHAVQCLPVLPGPLVSLGKEPWTHAVSHAQQFFQLAVNDAQLQFLAVSGVISGFII